MVDLSRPWAKHHIMGILKTSADGKVCCSFCGTTLLVKTYRCPFRYCEQVAMCSACSKKNPNYKNKSGHRVLGCEQKASELKAEQTARRQIFCSGGFLLASTRNINADLVHAVFRSESSRVGRFLPKSYLQQYEHQPNPTLDDFERLNGSALPEAPAEFDSPNMQTMLGAALRFFAKKQEPPPPEQPGHYNQVRLF